MVEEKLVRLITPLSTTMENFSITTTMPSTGEDYISSQHCIDGWLFRFAERSEGFMSLSNVNNSHQHRDRSSLIIISLVEQLAAAYEQDEERRTALVINISQSMIKMNLINPAFALPELSSLRAQYRWVVIGWYCRISASDWLIFSLAFLRLMSRARSSLKPVSKPLTLLGPDHNLASSTLQVSSDWSIIRNTLFWLVDIM